MLEVRAEAAHHAPADGEVLLLGAVHAVTGAMTRVRIGETRLLVDAGIAQGAEARSWSLPEAASDVHAIVLTHAHIDHVGSLPAILSRGFDKPIFATPATLEIAR